MIVIIGGIFSSCFASRFDLDQHRVEPKKFIVASAWNSAEDVGDIIKYLDEDKDCKTEYRINKNEYVFIVTHCEDTVEVSISKLNIPSDLEYVRILVNDNTSESTLSVFPETDIVLHGKSIIANKNNYLCNMTTSRPADVSVYILGDPMTDNLNKTMEEYQREYYMDSLWRIINMK